MIDTLSQDEQCRLMRLHLAEMPLAHVLWDHEFRVCSWNPAAEAIFGYPAHQAVGRHASFLVPDDDRAAVDAVWQRLLEGERTAHSTNDNLTSDGRRIRCRWTNTPLTGRDAAHFVAFSLARDITREVEIERELAHAQRLEAAALLTAGVAHDFNNLLTVILGSTEVLREMTRHDADAASVVEDVGRAAQRAAEFTRCLLDVARGDAAAISPLDLRALFRDLTPLLQRLLGEQITLVTTIDVAAADVMAERISLQQVLLNLAVNARDAMPAGGRLTATTARQTLANDEELPDGDYVALTLRDTGSGMDAATLAHAFEPFFTTKPAGRGTGLGLSLIRSLMRRAGGSVRLTSTPGGGTSAVVLIPAQREVGEPVARAARDREDSGASGGSESILVVDDDAQVRAVIAVSLRRLGYRLTEAGSGALAIHLAATLPALDLCIMDMVMPELDGRATAAVLRAVRPDLPVLYVSALPASTLAERGAPMALDGPLLAKPFTASRLFVAVRRLLDGLREVDQ